MKINSVELKNYRVHEDLKVNFSKGINLLIGKNGSGKSSILEAVGLVMFDAPLRTTQKEAIKRGKSNAYIKVEFESNDLDKYIVKKDLSDYSYDFYKKGNFKNKISDKNLILKKIKKLTGLSNNSKKIYESIVLAKQNKIIDIFSVSSKKREAIFNEIFDTKIYREIYQNFSLEYKRELKEKLIKVETSINNLKTELSDGQKIEKDLNKTNENIENLVNKINDKKDLLVTKKEKKEKLVNIQNQIEKLEEKLSSKKDLKKLNIENIKEVKKELEKSKKALVIIENTKDDYKKYQEIEKSLDLLNEKLEVLKLEKEKHNNLIQEKSKLKADIKLFENNNVNNNENIKDIHSEIQILKNKKSKKKIDIEKQKKLVESIKKDLNENQDRLSKLNKVDLKKDKLEKEIDFLKKDISKFENKDFSITKIEKKLENFDLIIKELNEKVNEKKEIENDINYFKTLISQNQKAYDALKDKVCPFLNEECKNIASFNVNEYFEQKNDKINKKLKAQKNKLDNYSLIDKKLKDINNKKTELEVSLKNYNNEKQEYEKDILKLENLKLNKKNLELEVSQDIELNNIKSEIEDLKEKNVELKTKKDNIDIEKSFKELEEIKRNLKNKEKKVKEYKDEIKSNNKKISDNRNNIIKLEDKVEKLESKLKDLEKIEKEISDKKSKLNNLKENYLKYSRSIESSKKVEQYKNKLDKHSNSLVETNNFIKKLENELEDKENEFSKKEFNNLVEKIKNIEDEINKNKDTLNEYKTNKKILQIKLKEYKEKIKKLNILKKNEKKLNKKINLTSEFRKNINSMGKEVAKYMLKEIAIKATENFREITGRSEQIIWENDNKKSYAVYLYDKNNKISFNMLSGGEKVAVALSIRSALLSELSNSNFCIFDEPTNNLDKERKNSLSDSLNIILKDIDQSIIVTHDNTFREMAENIIEL